MSFDVKKETEKVLNEIKKKLNPKVSKKPKISTKKISVIKKSEKIKITKLFEKKPKVSKKSETQNIKKDPELLLSKHEDNPIISPNPKNGWESWQTFNPAAILIDNNVHFLYRAIGDDGQSRFGYAMSEDGFKIKKRLKNPIYKHPLIFSGEIYNYTSGGSWGGAEDPRLVKIKGDDKIYLTYTACDGGIGVALSSINIDDFLNKRWNWSKPKLLSEPGKWNKNWIIFPEKIKGKYILMHSITPEILIEYLDDLEFKDNLPIKSYYNPFGLETKRWDKRVRAAGPPPIRTKYGWLLFYHAEDQYDPGKYKLGAMLLDLKDPTKIKHRCKQPILEPCEYYEMNGFKPGIVYALGSVVINGELIIYYGGADNYACIAHTNLDSFLKILIKGEKKTFKLSFLKKKKKPVKK
jgi:beta-1,2-mannobiose phosphorylase / 1,2-beta-oligomannan phosphorylase